MNKKEKSPFEITYGDLPKPLLEKLTGQLHRFSTAIIHLSKNEDGLYKARRIGSGTYVRVGELFGILTAQHVTKEFANSDRIGLFVRPEGIEHHYSLSISEVEVLEIAKPSSEEFGPDISFILLPDHAIGEIAASKTFHRLHPKQMVVGDLMQDFEKSLWFLWGVPALYTKNVQPEATDYENMREFHALASAGGPVNLFDIENYDLLDIEVHYFERTIENEFPSDWRGVSGGGIWRVYLEYGGKKLEPPRYILSGLFFHHDAEIAGEGIVRGHGPKSIYDLAVPRVLEHFG